MPRSQQAARRGTARRGLAWAVVAAQRGVAWSAATIWQRTVQWRMWSARRRGEARRSAERSGAAQCEAVRCGLARRGLAWVGRYAMAHEAAAAIWPWPKPWCLLLSYM